MVGNLKTEYSISALQGTGSPCLQAFPTLTPTFPQLIPPHPSEHGNINITSFKKQSPNSLNAWKNWVKCPPPNTL